ncbi:hypothetical protein CRG98_008563 [Punica granatum]|uniref:non-specific serine/threonine protein kinase n=1 Tax=Punica granatum TaxID=22663 RepID=A0A2I0KR73_PUNGR|nr:hypothetical protein CRG98_008563 [Punica granatum]
MESKKGKSESGSKGISGKLMRHFTLDEVARITENFDVEKIIGEGNFRKVFRGKLDDGLDYLHNNCNPPNIHRDIKTANILLDEHLQAKISDFGLSRIFSSTNGTFITTDSVGTRGYLDPEYCTSRSLTKKSDIYSFGVVLLELITARPVQGNEHVVDWAVREVKKQNYQRQIVDPRLDGQYDSDSADKLVTIAISCVEKAAAKRPDIHKVNPINDRGNTGLIHPRLDGHYNN